MAKPDQKPPAASSTGDASSKAKWGNRKKRHGNRTAVQPVKFTGGKDELDGNYFDCTGYGQSDRFVKTVQKIADHIGQEYKGGGITRTEVMTRTEVPIPSPPRPTDTITTAAVGTVTTSPPGVLDISDYQNAKKIVDYKIQNQTENRQKVFSLVWQQCTESMHAKMKAQRGYYAIEQALNGIELLRIIKLICFNIEDEKYIPQNVHETKAAFYVLKQGRDSDQAYQIRFLNTVEVIEQCGASLGEDPLTRSMVCKDLGYAANTTTPTEVAEITKSVRDYTLGAALILGADPDRYSSMIRGLKNASLAGRDEWPKNVTEAYNYLSKWEGDSPSSHASRDYEGTAFTSSGYEPREPREPQPWHKKMTCRNCNKVGHIAAFCVTKKESSTNVQVAETHEEAAQQLMHSVVDGTDDDMNYYADLFLCEELEHRSASFHQDGINGGRIPKEWILLDSQSTTDAFSNPDLLNNIHEVRESLTIHTQAGNAVTKLRGSLPGYGEVWYCPNGIANILSLARMVASRVVTFHSHDGNQFEVSKDDGSTRLFKQSQHGLYYFNMNEFKGSQGQRPAPSAGHGSTFLVNTVAENKARYTADDYKRAEKARMVQRRIGRPNTKRYMELAGKGRILNCDVTRQDIVNAEDIFGPDHGSLKGKTVRAASDQVRSGGLVPIPATIMSHYQRVTLCIDVMKVNKMPF
jgi:hypothetical protein